MRVLILAGCGQVAQPYPSLAIAGRGVSERYEENRQVKIFQNEILVNYIPALH